MDNKEKLSYVKPVITVLSSDLTQTGKLDEAKSENAAKNMGPS